MPLVGCIWCGNVSINVEYPKHKGQIKCRRCNSVMKVELEEDQLKSC